MANRTLLITFGCSWTFGVGVNYEPGSSISEFQKSAWDNNLCDKLSWRGLFCQKSKCINLNFSSGASSNQRQFRKAIEFFSSEDYSSIKQQFNKIIVLWGITSTARNELWNLEKNNWHNFMYSDSDDKFSEFMTKFCYDHDAEVYNLRSLMMFWNRFFRTENIENFWFDTFNSHNYNYNFNQHKIQKTFEVDPISKLKKARYESVAGPDWPSYQDFCDGITDQVAPEIVEEIEKIFSGSNINKKNFLPSRIFQQKTDHELDSIDNLLDHDIYPRDLMSYLMLKTNIQLSNCSQDFHHSNWEVDRNGMEQLIKNNILNPYTYHPTKKGHQMLCDYFVKKLQSVLI